MESKVSDLYKKCYFTQLTCHRGASLQMLPEPSTTKRTYGEPVERSLLQKSVISKVFGGLDSALRCSEDGPCLIFRQGGYICALFGRVLEVRLLETNIYRNNVNRAK